MVPLGDVQVNGKTWYSERRCCVYGPGTEPLNHLETGALPLAALNHILARSDAKMDEYLKVERLLRDPYEWRSDSTPGLVKFRWMQMIDRVLAEARMQGSDDAVQRFETEELAWFTSTRPVQSREGCDSACGLQDITAQPCEPGECDRKQLSARRSLVGHRSRRS
jgi:hypothetical protein